MCIFYLLSHKGNSTSLSFSLPKIHSFCLSSLCRFQLFIMKESPDQRWFSVVHKERERATHARMTSWIETHHFITQRYDIIKLHALTHPCSYQKILVVLKWITRKKIDGCTITIDSYMTVLELSYKESSQSRFWIKAMNLYEGLPVLPSIIHSKTWMTNASTTRT